MYVTMSGIVRGMSLFADGAPDARPQENSRGQLSRLQEGLKCGSKHTPFSSPGKG